MSLKATNNVETNKYELEIEISAEDFEAAICLLYTSSSEFVQVLSMGEQCSPLQIIWDSLSCRKIT